MPSLTPRSRTHDPAKLEPYEEEYLNRQDLIDKYRFSNGAHSLPPFPGVLSTGNGWSAWLTQQSIGPDGTRGRDRRAPRVSRSDQQS